jgi:hypothetical protein
MAGLPSPTRNLYRIVSFDRAVQLLSSDELYFSHPSSWEDPYDKGPDHKRSVDVFALCWCRKAVSDAMWRIYSPNALGVRIGTTLDRLKNAMVIAKRNQGIEFKIRSVKYLYPEALRFKLEDLRENQKVKPSFATTVAPLFLKRNAFDHELETRVVIYHGSAATDEVRKGVHIKVNARELIRSIWIDPRAPKEYAEAFTHYLEAKVGFKGVVKQSTLYAARDPDGL